MDLLVLNENLNTIETEQLHIPASYREKLPLELFTRLNNLYATFRGNHASAHPLLKKYLPETRQEPQGELLFADFFSGAGGLSQGLIYAGFQPAFVNDHNTDALETYYFNHTLPLSRFFKGDIKDLLDNFLIYQHLFEKVKVVAGGPPCQGFSMANRRNFKLDIATAEKRFIEDERNKLYKYFVRLLGIIKPDFFIMENVKGMQKVKRQIEVDIREATDVEYYFTHLRLDAQRFNVPQSRDRYILIGGRDVFTLEQIGTSIKGMERSFSSYKLKDALFGLPAIGTNPVKRRPELEGEVHGFTIRKIPLEQNAFLQEINKGETVTYLFNHKSRYNNENDLEIFRRLPEGANSLHESIQELNNYRNRDHIFKDKYYKLMQDEVCRTITSHMKYDCHMYIHPSQARGLSPREAARIQTFPDCYMFRGALNDWYQQIGNAVPVKLAEVVANQIYEHYR
ncbi:hypothetical protein CA264_11770 [Pontibacter actiniarum]|uniref:Cytosine-specific methyltransferase n=2 Tax=Pontibacter actiniarum TaxID=323450 RepID=A0A1X9YYE5_9BACT|nr:hypothetical protein CA264_11770 [Pontibacter actiniarum]